MNMDKLNRWLTLGANVGVLLGIFFLAFELRQNNALLQSEASIAYVEMRSHGLSDTAKDRAYLGTFLKAIEGEELTPVESLSLDFHYWSLFVNWEWEYEQYSKGVLEVLNQPPELRWRPVVNYYPRIRDSWTNHKSTLSPQFVNYMEENVFN
jgi:hypothetical protein